MINAVLHHPRNEQDELPRDLKRIGREIANHVYEFNSLTGWSRLRYGEIGGNQ